MGFKDKSVVGIIAVVRTQDYRIQYYKTQDYTIMNDGMHYELWIIIIILLWMEYCYQSSFIFGYLQNYEFK